MQARLRVALVSWHTSILAKWLKIRLVLSHYCGFPLVAPTTCSIGITSRCNSKCNYCNTWSDETSNANLHLEQFSEIVRSVRNLGVKEILISGGEPLLNREIVSFVRLSVQAGLKTRLITNGTRLTARLLDELVEAGLTRIGLSIDALDAQIYQITRGIPINLCLDAISALREAKFKHKNLTVDLYCVVTKHNLTQLLPLQEFAESEKFGIAFQTLQNDTSIERRIENDWITDAADLLFLREITKELIRRKRNGAPIRNLETYLRSIPDFFQAGTAYPKKCFSGYLRINIDENLNVKNCWMLPPVGNLGPHRAVHPKPCEPIDSLNARAKKVINIVQEKQAPEKITESLEAIWNWRSPKMRLNREKIKQLDCGGCLFPCHAESSYTFGQRH